MKKILIIEDRANRKLLLSTLLRLYNYDIYIVTPDEVGRLIEEEKADFVYLNLKETADSDDMNSLFENLRPDHRLRVRIINTQDHKLKFSRMLPFETFENIITSINDKIYKPFLHMLKK